MYLTSLSLKKTPRMFWGFFRIRKDRHLLRVVHPTAREKKKHHRWKRCTGWHLSEVFWPHSQPGLKHSAWLGSSLKKGNKVVRKSWEIRKFLLHNSRKNQAKKKNNTMFCLDPLLIGGNFSNFEEKQPIQKPTGVFVVNVGPWSAVSGYLQAYRLSLLWRCYVWGSPWLRVGGHLGAGWVLPPEVQQEVRPLKRYLLKTGIERKRHRLPTSSPTIFHRRFLWNCVFVYPKKYIIYLPFFGGRGTNLPRA